MPNVIAEMIRSGDKSNLIFAGQLAEEIIRNELTDLSSEYTVDIIGKEDNISYKIRNLKFYFKNGHRMKTLMMSISDGQELELTYDYNLLTSPEIEDFLEYFRGKIKHIIKQYLK